MLIEIDYSVVGGGVKEVDGEPLVKGTNHIIGIYFLILFVVLEISVW